MKSNIKAYLSMIGAKGGKAKTVAKLAAAKANGFQPGKGRKQKQQTKIQK